MAAAAASAAPGGRRSLRTVALALALAAAVAAGAWASAGDTTGGHRCAQGRLRRGDGVHAPQPHGPAAAPARPHREGRRPDDPTQPRRLRELPRRQGNRQRPRAQRGRERGFLRRLPPLRGGQSGLLRMPHGAALDRGRRERRERRDEHRAPPRGRLPGAQREGSPATPIDATRRRFVGWTSAGLAGVAIAPGVVLFDLAHGRAPDQPRPARSAGECWSTRPSARPTAAPAWSPARRKTACRTGKGADGAAVDPQGRSQGPAQRPRRVRAGDVPALRAPALRRRLPHRRLVQARRRHRAGRPAPLHRLPLLHDGLPLQGALVRVRAGDRPAPRGAARPRLRRVLHAVRPPDRSRRHAGLRRGLRRRRPPGHRVRRSQRSGQRDRPSRRRRGDVASCAPTCGSRPASATRGSRMATGTLPLPVPPPASFWLLAAAARCSC